MSIYEVFIKNVKQILENNGMTQAELARKLGMTPQQISQTLALKFAPNLETIDKIAYALGTTPERLISKKGAPTAEPKRYDFTFIEALGVVRSKLAEIEEFYKLNSDLELRLIEIESEIHEIKSRLKK